MKKYDIYQDSINNRVKYHFNNALDELQKIPVGEFNPKKLRLCSALVIETKNYYLLRSYWTFIACIDKRSDICYDALRLVYGFTHTSAQHISKFKHDYGAGKYGCEITETYRII